MSGKAKGFIMVLNRGWGTRIDTAKWVKLVLLGCCSPVWILCLMVLIRDGMSTPIEVIEILVMNSAIMFLAHQPLIIQDDLLSWRFVIYRRRPICLSRIRKALFQRDPKYQRVTLNLYDDDRYAKKPFRIATSHYAPKDMVWLGHLIRERSPEVKTDKRFEEMCQGQGEELFKQNLEAVAKMQVKQSFLRGLFGK